MIANPVSTSTAIKVERPATPAAGAGSYADPDGASHGRRSVTGVVDDVVRDRVGAHYRRVDGIVHSDSGREIAVHGVRRSGPLIGVRGFNRELDRCLAAPLNDRRSRVSCAEVARTVVVEHVEARSTHDGDVDTIVNAELCGRGLAGVAACELLRAKRELAGAAIGVHLVASRRIDPDDINVTVRVRIGGENVDGLGDTKVREGHERGQRCSGRGGVEEHELRLRTAEDEVGAAVCVEVGGGYRRRCAGRQESLSVAIRCSVEAVHGRPSVGVREHELECGVTGKVNEHDVAAVTSQWASDRSEGSVRLVHENAVLTSVA